MKAFLNNFTPLMRDFQPAGLMTHTLGSRCTVQFSTCFVVGISHLSERASDNPAGVQHMRLRVCKNKQNPVAVAAWDLPALTMTPSDLVVSSIEVEAPASVTAGNMLPSVS